MEIELQTMVGQEVLVGRLQQNRAVDNSTKGVELWAFKPKN